MHRDGLQRLGMEISLLTVYQRCHTSPRAPQRSATPHRQRRITRPKCHDEADDAQEDRAALPLAAMLRLPLGRRIEIRSAHTRRFSPSRRYCHHEGLMSRVKCGGGRGTMTRGRTALYGSTMVLRANNLLSAPACLTWHPGPSVSLSRCPKLRDRAASRGPASQCGA